MGAFVPQCPLKPFKVPYTADPDQSGSYRYTAKLQVQIALAQPNSPRTKRFEAIIDSGATRCLFDWSIADFLGIDRSSCKIEITTGIGGNEGTFLHDVTLHIPGGPVKATVGFKENLPIAGLLGMNGFFEHFLVTFDSQTKECILQRIFQA